MFMRTNIQTHTNTTYKIRALTYIHVQTCAHVSYSLINDALRVVDQCPFVFSPHNNAHG